MFVKRTEKEGDNLTECSILTISFQERRKLREGEQKEDSVDLEENACSSGKITFTRKNKRETKTGNEDSKSVPGGKQMGTFDE